MTEEIKEDVTFGARIRRWVGYVTPSWFVIFITVTHLLLFIFYLRPRIEFRALSDVDYLVRDWVGTYYFLVAPILIIIAVDVMSVRLMMIIRSKIAIIPGVTRCTTIGEDQDSEKKDFPAIELRDVDNRILGHLPPMTVSNENGTSPLKIRGNKFVMHATGCRRDTCLAEIYEGGSWTVCRAEDLPHQMYRDYFYYEYQEPTKLIDTKTNKPIMRTRRVPRVPNYDDDSMIYISFKGLKENGEKVGEGTDWQLISYLHSLNQTYLKDIRDLKDSKEITVKVEQYSPPKQEGVS